METIKIMQNGVEVEVEVAKVIRTDEEFSNILKSEASKGKGEILKALGVSVEEARTKMQAQSEVQTLTQKVEELQKQNKVTNDKLLANELGIKPDLVDKVIILANAAMTDGKEYKEVMRAEAQAIGAIGNATPAKVLGNPKSKEQVDLEKAEKEEMNRLRDLDPMKR